MPDIDVEIFLYCKPEPKEEMNSNGRLRWYRDLSKLGALKLRFQNCGFDIDVENIVQGKAGQHLWEILFGTNEVSGKAETSPSKGQVEWGSVAVKMIMIMMVMLVMLVLLMLMGKHPGRP